MSFEACRQFRTAGNIDAVSNSLSAECGGGLNIRIWKPGTEAAEKVRESVHGRKPKNKFTNDYVAKKQSCAQVCAAGKQA